MGLAPPPLDGPSLTSLRAFEAAARHGSFRRAAAELLVTPAAVAQHVKAVEGWAQQPLFERTARGVRLTESGVRARPALTASFRALGAAANQLRDGNDGVGTLRLAALPAIAALWLTPRLRGLDACSGGAALSVHAVDHHPDVEADGYDAVASYQPIAPGEAEEDMLVLVVAPDVVAALKSIDDLASFTWLRDLAWNHHWSTWLGGDVDRLLPRRTVDLSLFSMAVDAAVAGGGVLVGRLSLLSPHLADGRLVEPLARRVGTGDRLVVRVRHGLVSTGFGRWLLDEAARTLEPT